MVPKENESTNKENVQYSYATEKEIKKLWIRENIPEKVRTKESKKHYYFIDGPPYASGSIHIGTTFNRVMKDVVIRYHRQMGYKVLDTPGFDTHGVPIERKVQLKYSLKSKEDIEKFGIEKFITECKKFATEHIDDMSREIENLGQWMDWKHPYRTLDKKYMETGWWTFKKAVDKGMLYHGKYPVHVCPSCETSVSFNEIEHQELTDTSIYVGIQSIDNPNLYYVIWTTTPWTLPANMGIMINPSYTYVELIHSGKKYIVAKDLVDKIINELNWKDDYLLGEEHKGSDLVGRRYKPLLEEWINIPDDYKERSYKIISSPRFVHLEEGTGLVHCAPGHGKEDYAVGHENNIPAYCPVTISGVYDETIPSHKNEKVKELDPFIINYLQEKGNILGKRKVKHAYPVCWRCHSPLLQVALPQWFLKTEELRERLKEINEKEVSWYPTWAKDRFNDWLNSISDWPISRARYWGIPIPIWKCETCEKIEVFGSLKELKEKFPALDLGMDIHKPYIDNITYKCSCGGEVKRVPEIFDVWFDSGIASWASLGYPENKDKFNQYWPPDINFEGSDQIRGWWNSQLICSTIAFNRAPFKHISLHGMVLDVSKRKLSKSEGNDKPLEEWFNLYSIDYFRYYFAKEYIGTDLVVDEKKFKDIKRIFNLLDNTINFLKLYNDKINFITELNPEKENLTIEDQWILSRLNNVLDNSHKAYENTEYSRVVGDIEKFVLEDLSRVYIKLLRKREEKNNVLSYCISSIVLMLSPIAPHFTEYLYQKFENRKEKSIHLLSLPLANMDLISKNLEDNFNLSQNVIATSLSLREESKKRLRWVLPRVVIKTSNISKLIYFIPIMEDMINVERIELVKNDPKGNFLSKEINDDLVVYLDQDIPDTYNDEWERSELTRAIQDARKKMNLNPKDKVTLKISSDDKEFLIRNKEKIEDATSTTLDVLDHGAIKDNTQKLIEKEISFSF